MAVNVAQFTYTPRLAGHAGGVVVKTDYPGVFGGLADVLAGYLSGKEERRRYENELALAKALQTAREASAQAQQTNALANYLQEQRLSARQAAGVQPDPTYLNGLLRAIEQGRILFGDNSPQVQALVKHYNEVTGKVTGQVPQETQLQPISQATGGSTSQTTQGSSIPYAQQIRQWQQVADYWRAIYGSDHPLVKQAEEQMRRLMDVVANPYPLQPQGPAVTIPEPIPWGTASEQELAQVNVPPEQKAKQATPKQEAAGGVGKSTQGSRPQLQYFGPMSGPTYPVASPPGQEAAGGLGKKIRGAIETLLTGPAQTSGPEWQYVGPMGGPVNPIAGPLGRLELVQPPPPPEVYAQKAGPTPIKAEKALITPEAMKAYIVIAMKQMGLSIGQQMDQDTERQVIERAKDLARKDGWQF